MVAYMLGADRGEGRWMFDSLDTIKADAKQTDGAFGVVEFREFEGSGPPLHIHHRFAQGFFVLSGEIAFSIGDERMEASPGTWVFVPPGVPRAWICRSSEARVLSITAPGGFEAFYRDVGTSVEGLDQLPAKAEPDIDTLVPIAASYGVDIVGPPIAGRD